MLWILWQKRMNLGARSVRILHEKRLLCLLPCSPQHKWKNESSAELSLLAWYIFTQLLAQATTAMVVCISAKARGVVNNIGMQVFVPFSPLLKSDAEWVARANLWGGWFSCSASHSPALPDLVSQRISQIILVKGCSGCPLAHLFTKSQSLFSLFFRDQRGQKFKY